MANLLEPTQYYVRFPRWIRGRAGIARLTWVVLAAGLFWRVARYAMGFPLWGDESFVAFSFQVRDFAGMFDPPEYGQFVTLPFMLGEFFMVRMLGLSERALHLLPFLCGVGALLLFWPMARRMLRPRAALLAVAFLASTFYAVRHATEVKHYILDLLVSIGLLWSAWRVQRRPDCRRRWACLTVVAVVGVWMSFSAIFVAGGAGLVLGAGAVRRKSGREIALAAVCGALTLASFAAMATLSALPMLRAASWITSGRTWTKAFPPLGEPWRLPWWLLKIHTGRLLAYPVGDKNGSSALTLVIVIAGCVSLWRARRRDMLALLLCPLALNFIAAALRMYPYGTSVRISLHMAPAFCLLAGEGLLAWLSLLLNGRRVAIGVRVAVAVLGGIAIVGAALDIALPYKTISDRENRRAIRHMAAETDANADQWVIINTLVKSPPAPYIYDDGGGGARFRFYVHRLGPRRIVWGPRAEQVRPVPGRTWVLVYKDPPKRHPEAFLKQYVTELSARFGTPDRRSFPLHMTGKTGAIEAYVFGAAPKRGGP